MNKGLNRGFSGGSVAMDVELAGQKAVPVTSQHTAVLGEQTFMSLPKGGSFFYVTGFGQSLTGIEPSNHGRIIWLINNAELSNGANTYIAIAHVGAPSKGANIWNTYSGGTFYLMPQCAVQMMYDDYITSHNSTSRGGWRILTPDPTLVGSQQSQISVNTWLGSSGTGSTQINGFSGLYIYIANNYQGEGQAIMGSAAGDSKSVFAVPLEDGSNVIAAEIYL